MRYSKGKITIVLDQEFSTMDWELIEDDIANSLFHLGYRGYIDNDVTGNTVQIKNLHK